MSAYVRAQLHVLITSLMEQGLLQKEPFRKQVEEYLASTGYDPQTTMADTVEDILDRFTDSVWNLIFRKIIASSCQDQWQIEQAQAQWGAIKTELLPELQSVADELMDMVQLCKTSSTKH